MADSVLYDVTLAGPAEMPMQTVILHHPKFTQASWPIASFLTMVTGFGWSEPWIVLRSQETGVNVYSAGFRRQGRKWDLYTERGVLPLVGMRMDMCVYAEEPKCMLDSILENTN